MYHAPAEIASDHTAVHCSILGGTDCGDTVPVAMAKSSLSTTTTTTTTRATSSSVCRRLKFDVDDDVDDAYHQKSSSDSSETVLDYLERLYEDQVARWNMDFRTLTPVKGGRWRWKRVVAPPSLPAVDYVASSSCLTLSRNITTKKPRRKINGKILR